MIAIRHCVAVLATLLAGCATVLPRTETVFVVVRHAEKDTGIPHDPPLTVQGQARAEHLAALLGADPLSAVYSTDTRRTRATAQPTADALQLPVTLYDAKMDAASLAQHWRQAHAGQRVLIVGHSNTVPAIVRALCQCAVADIDESRYGQRFEVRIAATGRATLLETRY